MCGIVFDSQRKYNVTQMLLELTISLVILYVNEITEEIHCLF